MEFFKRHRELSILRDGKIPYTLWQGVVSQIPLIRVLPTRVKARLRVLASLLLQEKIFTGAAGMEIKPEMLVTIAAQACLPILELGLEAYSGWRQVIVYPDAFQVDRNITDENGVVHRQSSALSGEAWLEGPLILSWQDVRRDSFHSSPGRNVVIHEFAHKLDMLNGRANGMPPLSPGMPIEAWTRALSEAYETLLSQSHHDSCINPYAATNPAEFFAVACEYYFTAAQVLKRSCPAVYEQLRLYFRH